MADYPATAVDQFSDWRWRLNNLYYITDKNGRRSLFKMNWAQEQLFDEMWYLNVILKARQLGFTTFIQIFMLDAAVFNSDIRAGTIAHTQADAQVIFRDKIKYPYDNLPDGLRQAVAPISDNASELLLSNNSSIRVGTSMRSAALQYLHVSEYGKMCAKFPEKAKEVRTGSLNTVQAGNIVFIESTAEGQDGHFFDVCQAAQAKQRTGQDLTELDFKFHFFPWWQVPEYRLDPRHAVITDDMKRYFQELEENHGITLDPAQQAWYEKKAETQLEDMKREFPATPDEAFEAAIEGAYYGKLMARAELQGRIGDFPHDPDYPVHTAWDIGIGDSTAIWCFQTLPGEIRNILYYENHGEYLGHYLEFLDQTADESRWTWGTDYVPHDIKVREWAAGKTRIDEMIQARRRPKLVPDHGIEDGRNAVRKHLKMCTFDQAGCADGVKCLKQYRKDWDEKLGTWKSQARKDGNIHGADSFRYEIMGYQEYKPSGPLPDGPRDPAGRVIPQGTIPKVLGDMSYSEFEKINKAYEKKRRV